MLSRPEIRSNVVSALQRDPRIKRPELIAVSVDEIGTVVLRGAVESPRQRVAAVHDARQVEGVFAVIDHLKVHLPVSDRGADDAIRAAALERLIADDGVRSDHIHVEVRNGWLTLTGHVREDAQRVRAEEDLTSITGVTGVTNRIDLV